MITVACSSATPRSLKQFYLDKEMQEIKTITIQDGSTRFSKTITEQEQVLELLTLIQDIKMTWKNNQEKHGSWHYPIKEDS